MTTMLASRPLPRESLRRVGLVCILVAAASATCLAQEAPGFATVEDRTFLAKFDGSEQKYVIMTPQGFMPDQSSSLLIALHGHGSDRWQFVRQPRGECRGTRDVAAAHKILLVSPDYRATTSWMGPAAEADLLQIIQTLRQRFKSERVILCGGSMGGAGALTFTALHPDLIHAVVSLNGTANLVEYERFQDAIAESFGGTKEQVPDEYRKRSAEFFPKQFSMPFAATTGGKDNIVPPDSVLRLIERVREQNPNVLSLHQPEGGHSTSYEDTKRALEFVIAALAAK
jgi:pimeloyl-ACP methyl ester carboxylesterase